MTTVPAVSELSLVSGLASLSLEELNERAALQHRTDRKYLLHASQLGRMLEALPSSWAHLSIEGRPATTYSTYYFDTPDLACWRAHAQGRRLRWKARTRLYVEDQLCRFEVKTKDGRGRTVKVALDLAVHAHGTLTEPSRELLARTVLRSAGPAPAGAGVAQLVRSTHVSCARATLADVEAGRRVTVDAALSGELDGMKVGGHPEMLLVETKGALSRGAVDQWLVAAGVRPVSVSKYQVLTAALHGGLRDNHHRAVARRLLAPAAVDAGSSAREAA